jgi:hypothetical protein
VPDYIRRIARQLIPDDTDDRNEFIGDLARGLIDADKWQVEEDEEWMQF